MKYHKDKCIDSLGITQETQYNTFYKIIVNVILLCHFLIYQLISHDDELMIVIIVICNEIVEIKKYNKLDWFFKIILK